MSENKNQENQENQENNNDLEDLIGELKGVPADVELTLNELKAKYPALKANKKAAALKELGIEPEPIKPIKQAKTPEQIKAEAAKLVATAAAAVKDKANKDLIRKIKAAQKDGTTMVDLEGESHDVENEYKPKNTEAHLFHVELDKPAFNKTTGKKLSKAYVQKFTGADWNAFKKHQKGLGFSLRVLWNPTKFK